MQGRDRRGEVDIPYQTLRTRRREQPYVVTDFPPSSYSSRSVLLSLLVVGGTLGG